MWLRGFYGWSFICLQCLIIKEVGWVNLSVGFFWVKINDNVLISHLDAVYWLPQEVWRRGWPFLIWPLYGWSLFLYFYKDQSSWNIYSCKSCNVHLASENPIRNNQCIGLVQVFFFSNLQQYITYIQISKTIPIPAIYILQCSCSKDRVLMYAGFNDLKVCKLCVNQHRLKHRIKPLIAYNDIPEQFISYTFVHLAVLLGSINGFLNGKRLKWPFKHQEHFTFTGSSFCLYWLH